MTVCSGFWSRRGRLTSLFFFFNDTATTEIYTLSLHDALPISVLGEPEQLGMRVALVSGTRADDIAGSLTYYFETSADRKSTRLNSSHLVISYAVFCLKKKKKHSTDRSSLPQSRLPWPPFPWQR